MTINERVSQETLDKIIEAADEVITALAGTNEDVHKNDSAKMCQLWDDLNDRYATPAIVKALAAEIKQYRAAAEQPVAFTEAHEISNMHATGLYLRAWPADRELNEAEGYTIPLYAAPQVTSVPDEHYRQLSDLYHAQEKRLFKLAQRIKGLSFDKYAYSPSQAIDALEAAIFGDKEECGMAAAPAVQAEQLSVDALANVLRNAPLAPSDNQGKKPGSSPVIPDGWIPVSERMPKQAQSNRYVPLNLLLNCRTVAQGGYDDESFWIDGERINNVTHWMPMPAAPKQEAE